MTCSQSEHILARLGHRHDLTMTRMPLSRQTTTELIWLHLFINNNHCQTHDRSLRQSGSCVLPNSVKITYLTVLQVYVVIESLLLIDRTHCRNECHMAILSNRPRNGYRHAPAAHPILYAASQKLYSYSQAAPKCCLIIIFVLSSA